MKTELQTVFRLTRFFNILQSDIEGVKYGLKEPSNMLIRNINTSWLQSIWSKTHKILPIYLNEKHELPEKIPFGKVMPTIENNEDTVFEQDWNECAPKRQTDLLFNLIVPEQDSIQYFIQWQRYRKYWWSSITTTPSLFRVDNIKHKDNLSDVNIVANFPWGLEIVETLHLNCKNDAIKSSSFLTCKTSLEKALLILLLDAITNSTQEGYLRLHRSMAPYKFSFAVEKDFYPTTAKPKGRVMIGQNADSKNMENLQDLAIHLHRQLANKNIASWLPGFALDTKSQLTESLRIGVAYTAVLSDITLSNGIFHLLNSSTMLKEQIHITDLNSYAALICGK